jgi:hypothetical protein
MLGLSPSTLPTFMELPSLLAPLLLGFVLTAVAPPAGRVVYWRDDVGVTGWVKKEETGDSEGVMESGTEADAGREDSGEEDGEGECVWDWYDDSALGEADECASPGEQEEEGRGCSGSAWAEKVW